MRCLEFNLKKLLKKDKQREGKKNQQSTILILMKAHMITDSRIWKEMKNL